MPETPFALQARGVALAGGLLVTSAAQQLWVGYVGYGLGVGVAVACGYVPMVAAVSGWFERHRALAVGGAVAGSAWARWRARPP